MRNLARLGTAFLGIFLLFICLPRCGQVEEPAESVEVAESVEQSNPTEKPTRKLIGLPKFKAELRRRNIWSGGDPRKFAWVGRGTLATAIEHGLKPEHRVLDIGAGSLRVGWWFVQYIDPSNYHAIEPVEDRILAAVDILGLDDIHVYHNMDFEFPSLAFDFVIARSIWTHASKSMISTMLSEFAENATPNGKFLTSVHLTKEGQTDYMGEEWVGRVENTGGAAGVVHSLGWIQQASKENGLSVEVLDKLYSQTWLLVSRSPSPH